MQKPLKIVRFGDTTECKIKFGDLNGCHGEKKFAKVGIAISCKI